MSIIMQLFNNTLSFISLLLFVELMQLSTADYPGVIELVGYSNRRARTHYMPPAVNYDRSKQLAPYAKMQADIETVKQNIEKYNKLLTLDTKNLPDSQKDMLERIVERVARLKESLDINDNHATNVEQAITQQTAATAADYYYSTTTEISHPAIESESESETETETEANIMLDETTLLQLQTTMDKLANSPLMVTSKPISTSSIAYEQQQPQQQQQSTDLEQTIDAGTESPSGISNVSTESDEIPSTTFDYMLDATDSDEQRIVARSNNKMSAITAIDETDTTPQLSTQAASQRTLTTSSKLTKTRATKRPNTFVTNKPTNSPSSVATNNGNINGNTNNINANNVPVKRIQRPSSTSFNGQKVPSKQKVTTTTTTTQSQNPPQNQQFAFKPPAQQVQQQKLTQQQQQIIQTVQNKLTSQATIDKLTSVTPLTISEPLNQRITNTDGTSAILDTSNQIIAAGSSPQISAGNNGYNSGLTIAPSNYNGNIPTSNNINYNNNYNNNNNNNANANANDLVYDENVNASAIIESLNHAREEYVQQKVSGINTSNKEKVCYYNR